MTKKIPTIVILFFAFLNFSCNTTEPGNDSLSLSVEDISCTEAWLKLELKNTTLPAEVNLYADDVFKNNYTVSTNDTVIYIDELLPNKMYNIHSTIQPTNQSELKSNELSITTMDTTSNDFTCQTWTFGGEAGSSTLYDIAIISPDDIYAVGEIYLKDSLGNPDPNAYNLIHWNGSDWELKRINMESSCNAVTYPPLRAIIAFSENNIVVTSGGSIGWFDGTKNITDCAIRSLLNGAINKLWGTSSNDLYAVGNNGNIAHYQNGIWTKIESGTDVDLTDIWGTPDGKTVWISGYKDFKPTVLLKISNSILETVFSSRDYLFVNNPDHISGGIVSVWTNNNNFVYITTWYGLYRKSTYLDPLREEPLPPSGRGRPSSLDWHGKRSRATDINNIFTSGDKGAIHHFNGITYRTYQELADNGVTYYSLDVNNILAVLCGQKFENGITDKAIITIIKQRE